MRQYLDLLNAIKTEGVVKADRTGTGTTSLFGYQMRFNLQEGFPLLTTKKIFWKSVVHELLWFLKGETNIKYLLDNDVHIWDDWILPGTHVWGDPLSLKERMALAEKANLPSGILDLAAICEKFNDANDLEYVEAASSWLDEKKIPTHKLIDGQLGPVYGSQWRAWPGQVLKGHEVGADGNQDAFTPVEFDAEGVAYVALDESLRRQTIDQIKNVIARIKAKPDDRRLIVSAWNPAEIDQMALPPCHCLFQFYTRPMSLMQRLGHSKNSHVYRGTDLLGAAMCGHMEAMADLHKAMDDEGTPSRYLDCQLYQRSCDVFLGVPFNIASYALLTMMVAQVCGMEPGTFVHTYGDVHIYSNHNEQTDLQLTREPRALPRMLINPAVKDIFGFTIDDFTLIGYEPHPHIAGKVSV